MSDGARAFLFSRFRRFRFFSPALVSGLVSIFCLGAAASSAGPVPPPDTVLTHIENDGSIAGPAGIIASDPGDPGHYTIGSKFGHLIGADSTGAGGNIFYSLEQFDLAENNTAVFSAAPSAGMISPPGGKLSPSNALVRITNGSPSLVYGLVESEFLNADFYFSNRAGIVVGPSGSFDLSGASNSSGSFFLSSADRVAFDDGYFSTGGAGPAFLPSAGSVQCCAGSPSGFVFDSGFSGDVVFYEGSYRWHDQGIVQVVAANIRVIGGKLFNPGGETHLIAVGDAAITVPLASIADADLAGSGAGYGVVELLRGSSGTADLNNIGNSGTGATSNGRVVLRGGELVLQGANIKAGGRDGSEAAIDLEATEGISLRGSSIAGLETYSPSSADHLGIRLAADTIFLGEETLEGAPFPIASAVVSASGDASAGRVEILAREGLRLEGAQTTVRATASKAAGGGDVRISSGSLELAGGADIYTEMQWRKTPTGRIGDIGITAEDVLLDAGSTIRSVTNSLSAGGSVSLDLGGQLLLTDSSQIYTDSLGDPSSLTGAVGDVVISAGSIEIDGGSSIRSTTHTMARSGDVDVSAVGSILLSSLSGVATQPKGSGDAGDIRINAGSLVLEGGSAIISEAAEIAGTPGDVVIDVDGEVRVAGIDGADIDTAIRSMISTRVVNQDSVSDAGNITIRAGSFEVSGGALVTSRTKVDPNSGAGRAGSIAITATDSLIRVTGIAPIFDEFGRTLNSEISARGSGGAGGNITLAAPVVEITDGAGISATSFGPNGAGSIAISAGDEIRVVGSRISTEAGRSDGGNISLDAGNLIEIVDALVETEVLSDQGGAGEIMIGQITKPRLIGLNSSKLISNAAQGEAGDITISADDLVKSADTEIKAASNNEQLNGVISIDALEEELSGRLVPLEIAYLDVGGLLLPPCAARFEADRSSLTVRSRPGLGSDPGGMLPSPILMAGESADSAPLSGAASGRSIELANNRLGMSLPGPAGSWGIDAVQCGDDWPLRQ